jgi:hypothetical protein
VDAHHLGRGPGLVDEDQAARTPGGKGGKVKSRKQAIAIALSKARKKGKKVPKKSS